MAAPRRAALLALLAIASCAVVSAHSWLDCADWRFNNAAANSDPTLRRWSDADGKCFAQPRKFEVGIKPFGKMDEVQFYRHYVQKFTSGALACRVNGATSQEDGSSEGTQPDRASSYAPNKNVYGQVYGTMAQVYAGQLLCWRWPAKNHFAHVDPATNPLLVNWDDVPNRSGQLTQAEMDTKRLTDVNILWGNCPVAAPASNGDSSGVGSELRPCGNCFTVPQRAAGIYTVQWVWPFKSANSETYTSCADIEVLSGSQTAQDCVVSAWGAWGSCSSDCGTGMQTRSRTVTTSQAGSGAGCPTLVGTQACNTVACTNYISEHVVYDDSGLAGFSDWSWADKSMYSLTSTAVTHAGSARAIQWTPYNWNAVFFHYDVGPVSVADYQSVSFWVHGGSTGGQKITFSLVVQGQSSSPVLTYRVPTSSLVANTWTKVNLVFANLGMTTGMFDGIWWQANSADQQGTLYIDDVNFMHVHTGGAQPQVTADLCANVTCSTRSTCLGGSCVCTGGYSGTTCSVAPGISAVAVKSLSGLALTSLSADQIVTITWSASGSLSTVSVLLLESGSAIPTVLASQIINAGTFTWTVPATLSANTYTIRVMYSATVFANSTVLTKTASATVLTCSACSGHGTCDEDSAPACICRYGYTGASCSVAPTGVTKLRVAIIVNVPFSTYQAATDKFVEVFRADMAAALHTSTDQIEVASVTKQGAATSLVKFDLVSGGSFTASPLAITSTSTYNTAVASQLASADSNINRATYSYSVAPSLSGASRSQSAVAAVVAVLAAAAALAL